MQQSRKIAGLFWALGLATLPLQAQIDCQGSGCSQLPYSSGQLNEFYYLFKYQYADRVFKKMAEAAALANIMGPPVGTINLHRFTFGAFVGAGYVPEEKVNVYLPENTTLQDMPVLGGAINPRFMLGFNLGWLSGAQYAPYKGRQVAFLSPSRFDLYLVGAELAAKQGGGKAQGSLNANTYTRGAELRYHLVEGNEILGGPLLRFCGVSLGAGHYFSLQNVDYLADPTKQKLANASGVDVIWDGSNFLKYGVRMRSTKLEMRTGLQLLYLFNFTVGAGGAWNKGHVDFALARAGRVYADTDINSLLASGGYTEYINQLSEEQRKELFGSGLPDAYLTILLPGRAKPPARTIYGIAGVEINLAWLKISVEAIKTERGTFGASAGARFDF